VALLNALQQAPEQQSERRKFLAAQQDIDEASKLRRIKKCWGFVVLKRRFREGTCDISIGSDPARVRSQTSIHVDCSAR
jgi:hypothetical protein